MSSTLITLKLDQDLKDQATRVANDLGIPLATYLKMCLKKLVQEQRIDFQILEIPKENVRERWLKQQQDVQADKNLSEGLHLEDLSF